MNSKRSLTFFETFRAPLVSNCKKNTEIIFKICFITKITKGYKKAEFGVFPKTVAK
jgi:hypothetical protein